MIKAILISIFLIALVNCSGSSSINFSTSSNSCLWEKCLDETKAFSTYYATLSAPTTTNIDGLYKTCATFQSSKAIEVCESKYSYSSFSAVVEFTNFYKCARSKCYSVSAQSCRASKEGCKYAKDNASVASFWNTAAQKTSYDNAKTSCQYSTASACDVSLKPTAQNSCISAGEKKCVSEWITTNNISTDDPCYPCDIYNSSSIIIFSLLSSFLFIML